MKKTDTKANDSRKVDKKKLAAEQESRISRRKADMTVNVIKHNQAIDKLIKEMLNGLRDCLAISKDFEGQRMLFSRAKMQERVLNAALKMISQNKLQLWMIDDSALENDSK